MDVGEPGAHVRIDVDLAEDGVAAPDQHHELRLRLEVAREIVPGGGDVGDRSEEHTSELQSLAYLVCRLLLEKKKNYRVLRHSYSSAGANGHRLVFDYAFL